MAQLQHSDPYFLLPALLQPPWTSIEPHVLPYGAFWGFGAKLLHPFIPLEDGERTTRQQLEGRSTSLTHTLTESSFLSSVLENLIPESFFPLSFYRNYCIFSSCCHSYMNGWSWYFSLALLSVNKRCPAICPDLPKQVHLPPAVSPRSCSIWPNVYGKWKPLRKLGTSRQQICTAQFREMLITKRRSWVQCRMAYGLQWEQEQGRAGNFPLPAFLPLRGGKMLFQSAL